MLSFTLFACLVTTYVLEERYNRESTPRQLEMLKKVDNWTHGSFYLNTGPIVLGEREPNISFGKAEVKAAKSDLP